MQAPNCLLAPIQPGRRGTIPRSRLQGRRRGRQARGGACPAGAAAGLLVCTVHIVRSIRTCSHGLEPTSTSTRGCVGRGRRRQQAAPMERPAHDNDWRKRAASAYLGLAPNQRSPSSKVEPVPGTEYFVHRGIFLNFLFLAWWRRGALGLSAVFRSALNPARWRAGQDDWSAAGSKPHLTSWSRIGQGM